MMPMRADVNSDARVEVSKISDREKLAAHWLAKADFFNGRLARTSQVESDLKAINVRVPRPLSEAVQP
jgi:uncharacterized protein YhdP